MRKLFPDIIFILGILIIPTLTLAQDECASAVDIPVFNYSTCGDMALETIDFASATPSSTTPSPTCGSFSSTTNDLWYSYTVPAGVTEMAFHMFNSDLTPIPMISPDASSPAMAVYSGNCSALTLLDCFEGEGSFMSNAEIRWETIAGLVPGETIYMRVWDENNVAQQIFIAASVILDMPEDDCDTPIPLSEGGCNILSSGGDIDAPETCGWNTTDNTVFYTFTVDASDSQPYEITVEDGNCYQNGSTTESAEIQFAIYDWNGSCNGIGGSPDSETPNNSTYHGCASGTGSVTFSETLPPGDYVLAMDGYSMLSGNSLCTYGIAAPSIPETDPELEVYLSTVDNSCGQSGSASITVLSSCGSGTTVEWGPSGNTGLTETNLVSGAYSVTVTDNDPACGDTVINFNIEDNSDFTVTVVSSGGTGSVTLTAEVDGANANDVTFQWDDPAGSTTQSITVTDGGTYTCSAIYGTCSDESSYTVVIGEMTVISSVNTDLLCNGDNNGAIDVTIDTGIADFDIDWGINNITTSSSSYTINGLSAGSYSITVTDANGSQAITSTTLVEPSAIVLSEVSHVDVDCNGNANGEIEVSATGGTAPYSYILDAGASQLSGLFTGLLPGTYTIEVTDANGCTTTISETVTEPAEITLTTNPSVIACDGDDVTLFATPVGGTPPYSFFWNIGNGYFSGSSSLIFQPLSSTDVLVYAEDASLCRSEVITINISVSPQMYMDLTVNDVNCGGGTDGSATLLVTGGIPPFDYSWDAAGSMLNGLGAGFYDVTITDVNSCSVDTSFVIDEPVALVGNIYSHDATCPDSYDGDAYVTVAGGTPPYNYHWSTGSFIDSVNNLPHGVVAVTVTDEHGCWIELETLINSPDDIIIAGIENRRICIGGTASISVNATGGTPPYSFHWIGDDGFEWFNHTLEVSPDTTTVYSLTVTDAAGCSISTSANVNVYPELEILSFYSDKDSVCKGDAVTFYTYIDGGNGGPYELLVNGNVLASPTIVYPQSSSWYYINVSDACETPSVKDSIYIHVFPSPLNSFVSDKVADCPPFYVHFSEMNPDNGNTYLWNFGDAGFSNEQQTLHLYETPGTYSVTLDVTDEHGCKTVKTHVNMIQVFPVPEIDFYTLPADVSMLNPEVEFYPITSNTDYLYWFFGDGDSTLTSVWNPVHYYDGIGEYLIKMVGENTYNCKDTAYQKIRIREYFTFYAPTAFSPNFDGDNDCFGVCGEGIDPNEFSLIVFDRWGGIVFETDTYDENVGCSGCGDNVWDGTMQGNVIKGDCLLETGVYSWVCVYKDKFGIKHKYDGLVRLIR